MLGGRQPVKDQLPAAKHTRPEQMLQRAWGGAVETAEGKNPWQYCLGTLRGEALPRRSLPHQLESFPTSQTGPEWRQSQHSWLGMGHWARFQEAGGQTEGVDTDGKWGNRDTLVNYVGEFPSLTTIISPTMHRVGTAYRYKTPWANVSWGLWAPCLFDWLRTFSVFGSDLEVGHHGQARESTHALQDGTGAQAVLTQQKPIPLPSASVHCLPEILEYSLKL